MKCTELNIKICPVLGSRETESNGKIQEIDDESSAVIIKRAPSEEDDGRPLRCLLLDGKGDEVNKFLAASIEDMLLSSKVTH